MNADFNKKFLTNTDETGRFMVSSYRTGAVYYVEPIITSRTPEFGSIDPATGKLMHKKGDGKYTGGIKGKESMITKENGFDKIHMLEKGMSPHAQIDYLDSLKPDRVAK